MSKNIIIIGAGISGITTALTLQLLGNDTHIYTKQTLTDVEDKNKHPQFSSLFPAASIIPHSVYGDQIANLFHPSQKIFYELQKKGFPGVTLHKHYEIFEEPTQPPPYCDAMLNTQMINRIDQEAIPKPGNDRDLNGWVFDCIFTDWPHYFPALINLYTSAGGQITQQSLQNNDIKELPAPTIINCSGTGSPALFDDPVQKQLLLQGHLLHKPEAPLITDNNETIISYNYTPKADIYADAEGQACDVYCYPRKDGWILGGSRQLGTLNEDGQFRAAQINPKQDTYEIDNTSFPAQIIDLNQDILHHTFGLSIGNKDELQPSVGYRYIRKQQDGLRLEQELVGDKTVIHNYGHGGAGVTLSWGCGIEVAQMLSPDQDTSITDKIIDQLSDINFSV